FMSEANGVASLVGAVDDAFAGTGFLAEQVSAVSVGAVAVPTGSADGVNGDKHTRTGHFAIANGIAQADIDVVARADVSDGGDAGHQGDLGVGNGVEGLFGDWFLQGVELALLPIVGAHHGDVRVSIDEAGQKSGIAKVDHFCAGWSGR